MKPFIFSILLIFLTLSVALGQRGSLKGVIVDEYTAENIPFATVAITKSGEEVFFTGTVSDQNGEFLLENLPFGIYQVDVSFIGYNSRQIPDVTLSSANRNNDLGSIELALNAIGLEQVEVRAAAMTSVNRIDRTTYRASDFETARGGSALDVLSRLPSVTIRGEDEISVRGSSDFAVYLNGKPTNMSASMLLGQIPGDNIESIDIITVPTSRFEAQGHAGIINITTKRYTNTGLMIMTTGMLGGALWNNVTDVLSNHVLNNNMVNGGLSMNYIFNRVNLHGSINYSDRNDKGIGEVNSYIYQDVSQPFANTFYHFNGEAQGPDLIGRCTQISELTLHLQQILSFRPTSSIQTGILAGPPIIYTILFIPMVLRAPPLQEHHSKYIIPMMEKGKALFRTSIWITS